MWVVTDFSYELEGLVVLLRVICLLAIRMLAIRMRQDHLRKAMQRINNIQQIGWIVEVSVRYWTYLEAEGGLFTAIRAAVAVSTLKVVHMFKIILIRMTIPSLDKLERKRGEVGTEEGGGVEW